MRQPLDRQEGQMTIEAVLLLLIMVSVFTVVHTTISSRNYLSQIVEGPWSLMQGMIANGVWQAGDSKARHPNVSGATGRRATPEPR